ncbi:Wzz/FepE/Etk N-terminal domain-containing protein [Calderihabitans maritimus]|uniref:Wzz/FepE/Etk N-terminal domain-containing protein n=1 Tax=Calderihabitans maritimus TaxID=1246530 RepID=UPI001864DAB7|nr:Wzz/FepE/Etk N-terminal domain-containing protein [Calderihabitans maritimus]
MLEQEVDLREYVLILWRRKWLVTGIFLAAVILSAAISTLLPPVYEVSATLALGTYDHPVYTQPTSVKEILTSDDTLRTVIERLWLDVPAEAFPAFKKKISVKEIKDTSFLRIKVLYEDRETAKAIIQEMVNVLREKSSHIYEAQRRLVEEHLKRLEQKLGETEEEVDLLASYRNVQKELLDLQDAQLVEQPITPIYPVRPRKLLNVTVAGILGLTLGIFMACLLDYFKNSPETGEQS